MISGILLSAGLSSRFHSPKALALVNKSPAIQFFTEKLLQSALDEIIIILGANHEQIQPVLFKHKRIRVVYNKDYKFGQTSSMQSALKALTPETSGFMVLPVDCPFIASGTIDRMIDQFKKAPESILIPTFEGRRGHPPIFDICFKDPILALDHSQGLHTIQQENPQAVRTIEINDAGITQSFNTPEELAQIKKIIGID